MEDRKLTDADAKAIGKYMADELFLRLHNEQEMEALATIWTKSIDRRIGSTVRRAIWLFLVGVGIAVTLKLEELLVWLKS